MVSPIFMGVVMRDYRRVNFDENCGQGHPVLIYINNKSECALFEKGDEKIKNGIWTC